MRCLTDVAPDAHCAISSVHLATVLWKLVLRAEPVGIGVILSTKDLLLEASSSSRLFPGLHDPA